MLRLLFFFLFLHSSCSENFQKAGLRECVDSLIRNRDKNLLDFIPVKPLAESEELRACFQEALELDPWNADVYTHLATALVEWSRSSGGDTGRILLRQANQVDTSHLFFVYARTLLKVRNLVRRLRQGKISNRCDLVPIDRSLGVIVLLAPSMKKEKRGQTPTTTLTIFLDSLRSLQLYFLSVWSYDVIIFHEELSSRIQRMILGILRSDCLSNANALTKYFFCGGGTGVAKSFLRSSTSQCSRISTQQRN